MQRKYISFACFTAFALAVGCMAAHADGFNGHGGFNRGEFHGGGDRDHFRGGGDHDRFHGGDRDHFHGGGDHDGFRGSFGINLGVPLFWGSDNFGYYPPPAYYAPTVPPAPPVYTEQGGGYWYYCTNPPGYYPYVPYCPTGWFKVVPQPTGTN